MLTQSKGAAGYKGKRSGGSRNTPLTGNTQNLKSPAGQAVLTPTKNLSTLKPPNVSSMHNGLLLGGNNNPADNPYNRGGAPSNFLLNTNKDMGSLLPPASTAALNTSTSASSGGGSLDNVMYNSQKSSGKVSQNGLRPLSNNKVKNSFSNRMSASQTPQGAPP